ncbi:MAG: glycosyltransferase family 4 protein [Verrucomicrobia bacterium]|nr:glycosyltransferase family 4 protein [Verrucomicrobiota bacterium]
MKFVFLTPGTGDWHCGACMRDNALAKSLLAAGHGVSLLPMYLPLYLDEPACGGEDAAPVFFGGVTVYLRQRFGWFRHAPAWLTRWLDRPDLLRRVAKRAAMTAPSSHGEMTVAMLRMEHARLDREMDQLVAWLKSDPPDVLCLSTVLQAGMIRMLKQRLPGVKILASFQGEDSFLDGLPEPFCGEAWSELAVRAREADALVAPSAFYAGLMEDRLGLPRETVRVLPNGIDLAGYRDHAPQSPPVIGYLARMCREKGLEPMVDAFIHLRRELGHPDARLHIAGAATAADQPLIGKMRERLAAAGLLENTRWQPNLSRDEKTAMLAGLSLFSVPAVYPEAFGLYVAEALAAGVPVVQPAASSFPEMLDGIGRLVPPGDSSALAGAWHSLLRQPDELRAMAVRSRRAAESRFSVEVMRERFLQCCRF